MTVKPISGITISFTADEIEWLNWIMTEVLSKSEHAPPHNDVTQKIQHAMQLVQEFKKFGDDWQRHQEQRQQTHDVTR